MPHPLQEVHRLSAPMFSHACSGRSAMFGSDRIVDVVLVVTFPGVFLRSQSAENLAGDLR